MNRVTSRSEHNGHDRLLVSRYATDDAAADEFEQARRLIAECADCAALAADIRLLSTAIAALPAPARPRDFGLSHEQAARVRGTFFERFLRRLAGPGMPVLRPVAGVALSIGLALVVIGTALPLPAQPAMPMMGAPEPVPAAVPAPEAPPQDRAATPGKYGATPGAQVADPQYATDSADEPGEAAMGPGTTTEERPSQVEVTAAASTDWIRLALVYGGVTTAAVAFAVLLLAWYARRREDPLVR